MIKVKRCTYIVTSEQYSLERFSAERCILYEYTSLMLSVLPCDQIGIIIP